MAVSRYSSEARRSPAPLRSALLGRIRGVLALLALALPLLWATGCVTVRPEEKEYLADPSMTFDEQARVQAQEQHVFNNREGSFGAAGASGGGCGCN